MPEDSSYRDLCSLDDVAAALKITFDGSTDPRRDLLTRLIKAASSEIYAYTDREFISETKDYWADPTDTETRLFDARLFALSRDFIEVGDLMEAPTTVNVLDKYGNVVHSAVTDYTLYPQNKFPSNFLRFLRITINHDYQVQITGKWGWPTVPEDVRNGCIETVRLWYDQMVLHSATIEQELSTTLPLRNLPPHVIVSLNKYRRLRG